MFPSELDNAKLNFWPLCLCKRQCECLSYLAGLRPMMIRVDVPRATHLKRTANVRVTTRALQSGCYQALGGKPGVPTASESPSSVPALQHRRQQHPITLCQEARNCLVPAVARRPPRTPDCEKGPRCPPQKQAWTVLLPKIQHRRLRGPPLPMWSSKTCLTLQRWPAGTSLP